MKKLNRLIFLTIIIIIPQSILANAGTALMWMPIIQLILGNIIIGIIEGFFTALIFKTKWIRSILIMIAGNYVSWLIGNGLITVFQTYLIDSLFNLKSVFALWIISLVILFFLTVLIELPFFRWTFAKNERNWSKPWKLTLILNAFTYAAMIMFYLSASKYNFFTDLKINQSLLENKNSFELYYMNNGEVFRGKINSKIDKIFQIPEDIKYPYFQLKPDTSNKTIDLFIANYYGDTLLIQKSFIDENDKLYYPKLYKKYSRVFSDFRDTLNYDWDARAGSWAIEGLTIRDNFDNKENYAFEVPWMFWGIGQISIINNSELICVINNRIIILNKDTKEIGFITKGNDYIVKKE